MSESKSKKAARFMWAVKGHIPDWLHYSEDEELTRIFDSYFKRLWGNHEAYLAFEGFDNAWEISLNKKDNKNEESNDSRTTSTSSK